ncbi:hypothetical protein ES708_10412 [subsurface metagenome]
MQGIDSTQYVDDKAAIGTLAHQMIADHLRGVETDTSDYSAKQIDQAENSLLSYFEWAKTHTIEPVLIEVPLVSEAYGYGGTIDCLAQLDGKLQLLDFKTGKGIWPEMVLQLAAYLQLLTEHGHVIHTGWILRVGRDETEGFETRLYKSLATQWEIFTHCLAIYCLQREVKKGGY